MFLSSSRTLGILEKDKKVYFETGVNNLYVVKKDNRKVKKVSKFPPQVEDLTVKIPEKTYVQDVVEEIKKSHEYVSNVELVDIYKRNNTFRIYYHTSKKTLTDKEVEKARDKVTKKLREKFATEIV